jgi:hypothetical protein
MSMSTFAARIGTTLIALCLAVGVAGTASAAPASHTDGEMAAPIYPGCYLGDGHSWH